MRLILQKTRKSFYIIRLFLRVGLSFFDRSLSESLHLANRRFKSFYGMSPKICSFYGHILRIYYQKIKSRTIY